MPEYYLWIKAIHVISVISWMAGMLYLPRLFVYHAATEPGTQQSETFKIMELRLYRYIMGPASVAAFLTGLGLIWVFGWAIFHEPWFHVKLACVIMMLLCHHALGRWRKDFAADRNTRTTKFFRIANEVPTLLMVVIVIMVIVKPFS
jgi:protoporphyrinogen IX oxidase